MTRLYTLLLFLLLPALSFAENLPDADAESAAMNYLDSVDRAMPYKHGTVQLRDFASLNVPPGFKFIPQQESQWLVEKIWGNPARPDVMGMLVREDYKVSNTAAWAFIVSWDESGFVKDDDAADMDYDELLTSMQKDEPEENKQRQEAGYPSVHIVQWAAKPFYDKENKVLHWAKDLKFGDNPEHTLNYDVRILGRKGVLSMNAVGDLTQLGDIRAAIPSVIHAATFTSGNKYTDFNPKLDKVAAYTIGGLIAGKILAKVGLFALVVKNIKLIGIALVGGIAALRKRFSGLFGRRRREDELDPKPATLPINTDPQDNSQTGTPLP